LILKSLHIILNERRGMLEVKIFYGTHFAEINSNLSTISFLKKDL